MGTVEDYKLQGNLAYSVKDFEKAHFFYTEGLNLCPNDAVLLSNRAAVYLSQEKYSEALLDSCKSIESDPTYAKGYYRKACALRKATQIAEALETIIKALSISPNNPDLRNFHLEVYNEVHNSSLENPETDNFNELITWLIKGGAIFPKIYMKYYTQDYRGVHCSSLIERNEIFIYIPKSHIITLEMAKAAPIGFKMVQANLDLFSPKHSFLTSFILQELQKPLSAWKPYLSILPQHYKNFPIFYTEEEKEWLAGSPFLDQIIEKISDIEEDYKTICQSIKEFSQFSLESFSKYRMAVSSRIFGVQIDDVATDVLVPLADMLNHKRPRETSWTYDQALEGFIVEAIDEICPGAEVLDSYGKKCNSRFLLNYGFIVLNNDANEYPFIFKLKPTDSLYEHKKLILENSTNFVFRLQTNLSEPFDEFLATLRFLEVDDEQELLGLRDLYMKENAFALKNIKFVSVYNEQKTLRRLNELSRDFLSRYHDTIEEDQEIVKTDITQNQKNCVFMRLGEKIILEFFIHMAEDLIPTVGVKASDIDQEIVEKYREYFNFTYSKIKNND
jgi:protein-histidine N-methyltransferase